VIRVKGRLTIGAGVAAWRNYGAFAAFNLPENSAIAGWRLPPASAPKKHVTAKLGVA
jgi:hypothetical protein